MNRLCLLLVVIALVSGPATARESHALLVGGGKADITPAQSGLPEGTRIVGRLHARSIIILEGKNCAVLTSVDYSLLPQKMADAAIAEIERTSHCARENIRLSATHTHSAVASPDSPVPPLDMLLQGVARSVADARSHLRPARQIFGTGEAALNVNRDLKDKDGSWLQGPNRDGPSDKTVTVLAWIDEAGVPIGIYASYAMHPINFYRTGVISPDFPGFMSDYIESRFDGRPVALFVQATSGDQNPLLLMPRYEVAALRIGKREFADKNVFAPPPWKLTALQSNANRENARAASEPIPANTQQSYAAALPSLIALSRAEGAILGETIIDIMRDRRTAMSNSTEYRIRGAEDAVQCPGWERIDNSARQNVLPTYRETAPVAFRVGILQLGDALIASVNAELYSEIGSRLGQQFSGRNFMIATLTNGHAGAGYVYSDHARDHLTFQVIGSKLKPGCAEQAIVDKIVYLASEGDDR